MWSRLEEVSVGDLDADAVERFIGSAIRVQQAVESSSGGRSRRTSSTRRAAGSLDDEAGQGRQVWSGGVTEI